ncbi:MAG TPA: hypothetical protein VHK06_08530 [Candidatus Limnocylindria bacterium]|nr:hypothetical protein [Candidatus Limnocylindria bacterium]
MRLASVTALCAGLLLALAGCAGEAGAPTDSQPTAAAPSATASDQPAPSASGPMDRPTEGAGEESQPDLVGVLDGDASLEGGCAWLETPDGERWQVMWPAGYHVMFDEAGPMLMGPDGSIAAGPGDRIGVTGKEAGEMGSVCQVGPIFQAEDLVATDR